METQRIAPQSTPNNKQTYLVPVGQSNKSSIPISEFFSIGRDDSNHLALKDDLFISSRHARLEKRSQGYFIKDMRSKNGTFVNGTPIVEALLRNNDKIQFGEKIFIYSHSHQVENTEIISKNPQWGEQLKRLPAFASTDFTLLIQGPSGSGKDILAKWIHNNGSRKNGPFITMNCGALSSQLVESELFGHIRGAYTGATEDRLGAFQAARAGTLFLDEIGDLPITLQPKLLRVLENKEVRPVGSDRTHKTNVRIIAATHKNLSELVQKKEFREDLFHRLNICQLTPPALIDRMEDFEKILYSLAKDIRVGFSFQAIEHLKNHDWPGNIRELKNLVTRAAAYFPGKRIQVEDLNSLITREVKSEHIVTPPGELPPFKQFEKDLIIQTLKKHQGHQKNCADELKMPKSTLNDKLKKFNIDPRSFKPRSRYT